MNNFVRPRHAAAAALFGALLATSAHAQTASPASFYVVHGIPGRDLGATVDPALPVDVLVNDALCLLPNLTFGQIKGPYDVPAGAYNVKISLANPLKPCSNAPVINQTVTVTAGENASIVAALSTAGAPTALAFANDLSQVKGENARIIVAHAADAPPVNVLVRVGKTTSVIKNLKPATDAAATIAADQASVSVTPAGSQTVVIGPDLLRLPDNSATLAFAVGSAKSGSLTLLTRTILAVL